LEIIHHISHDLNIARRGGTDPTKHPVNSIGIIRIFVAAAVARLAVCRSLSLVWRYNAYITARGFPASAGDDYSLRTN
tara:strand:+ start:1924 stop:2157 length:234 start_codon:yes stop_codon:yes gene_type:complete